jgi:hypothetical protein
MSPTLHKPWLLQGLFLSNYTVQCNCTAYRILTVTIFLDRITDLDPFEKLDLILHSGTLAFSGSPIRSDLPIHLAFKGPKMFVFLLVNLFDRKRVTFKGSTQTLGVKYELDRTETIAADHYYQA